MHPCKAAHARKIGTRETVLCRHLERESSATLTQTTLEDALPSLRLKTCTEPVRSHALHLLRLIVSLHGAKIARILGFFKRAGESFDLSTGYKHVDGQRDALTEAYNERIMIPLCVRVHTYGLFAHVSTIYDE